MIEWYRIIEAPRGEPSTENFLRSSTLGGCYYAHHSARSSQIASWWRVQWRDAEGRDVRAWGLLSTTYVATSYGVLVAS